MLLGILLGVVIGVAIAMAVIWYLKRVPLPFENKYERVPPTAPAEAGQPKQLPLPGKKAESEEQKRRFDFYGILEGKQSATPPDAKPGAQPELPPAAPKPEKPETREARPDTPPPAPVVVASERFYLQVGAFQKTTEADSVKAKLTLQGIDAEIVEAEIPDKGRMFRVRAGPYASLDEANKMRHQLADNGMQATLIKLK